jgi:hypothetical protein
LRRKCQSAQLKHVTIGNWIYFHLVRTFDLAPPQGASLWVVVPRVKTLG